MILLKSFFTPLFILKKLILQYLLNIKLIVMKKHFYTIILILVGLVTMSATPTVYFIGDSTMADYDPAVYPNQRGWGQMFRNFLVGDISFVNAARNGRSTRSFYTGNDSLWAGVRTKLKAGDYVFIQFAHNDEKRNGLTDTISMGGVATAPWDDYQDYLRKFVTETRSKGGNPILVTPIVRCYFSGTTITAKGKHNLGTDDSTLNYVRAMKSVARELSVPLIDHTTLTCNLAESLGATNAYSTIYVTTDQTHLNPTGGMLYAQLAVQDMIRQDILTNYLNASPNIIITPSTLDFGNSYIGTYSSLKFSLSGLSLTPADGNVTISAPIGFKVGLTAAGTFTTCVNIPYSGGNLTTNEVFVHFEPGEENIYSDSISVSYGQNSIKKLGIKGTGLAMSSGVDASVFFPLIANATPSITGPVLVIDESWTGTYAKNYAAIATWPSGITAIDVQRNSISATANNVIDTWPASEIDINTARYIQFGIKANAGTRVTVDSIGLYAGAAGGSGLKYRVLYSKNADFSNPVTLEDKTSNTSNTMVALSYKPMVQFTESEGFYLRFYPWYNGSASLKYLCLSGLTFKCKVNTINGLNNTSDKKLEIFPNPSNGIFRLLNTTGNYQVEVYNLTGLLIKKQNITTNAEQVIDLSTYAKGSYIIKTVSQDKTATGILILK